MSKFLNLIAAVLCSCLILPSCSKVMTPEAEKKQHDDEIRSVLFGSWDMTHEDYFFDRDKVYEKDHQPGYETFTFSPEFDNSVLITRDNYTPYRVSPYRIDGDNIYLCFSYSDDYLLKRSLDGNTFQLVMKKVRYTGNPDLLVERNDLSEDGVSVYCTVFDYGRYYYKKDGEYILFGRYLFNTPDGKEITRNVDEIVSTFVRLK